MVESTLASRLKADLSDACLHDHLTIYGCITNYVSGGY